MKLRDYYEVREWLEQYIPQTYTKNNLGLERIKHLLKLLGNPERKFKSILVGGTSGKGSTAYYLARALEVSNFQFPISNFQSNTKYKILNKQSLRSSQTAGLTKYLKIGLHISPHLSYIGERMQINGKPIAANKLVELVNEVRLKVESMKRTKVGLPSYFEILVAVSFLYFAREKVDWAVVEVGLGGRLDATNVLSPELSVITNVGLDHTDILGKTIEEIAREKAGIIKSFEERPRRRLRKDAPRTGIIVVTGTSGRALEVIEKIAKDQKNPLKTINTLRREDRVYFEQLRNIKDNIDADLGSKAYVTDECFFLVNLSLKSLGLVLSEGDQLKVFSAKFAARFEEIDDGILVDGAHNKDKARALIKWVKKRQQLTIDKGQLTKIILVCAFKRGKDWKGILRLILKELDVYSIYATQFNAVTDTGPTSSQRLRGINFLAAVEPEEIKKFLISNWSRFQRKSKSQISKVKTFENSQEAVWEALRKQGPTLPRNVQSRSLVLITGSLYLAGEARAIWESPEF